jgi:chromosomal replication initiation ATPase DnaA
MTRHFKRYLNRKDVNLLEVKAYIDRILSKRIVSNVKYPIKPQYEETVLREMAAYWGVPIETALTKRRFTEQINCKHAFRFALRVVTGMKMEKIGALLNCDHASVSHSIKVVNDTKIGDKEYYSKCLQLAEHLRMVLIELESIELDLNQNQPTLYEIPCDIFFHN